MEEGWIIIKDFPHSEGAHCESTSLRDQINYLGFNLSEAMIFGLDATMGFGYFGKWVDESGLLIGGKSGTITEKSLVCRILGITIDKRDFSNPDLAWSDTKQSIDKGTPLLILADMGYLSYFNWDEDFHFGGHSISIFGYNKEKQLALVCDNNFNEPVKIPISNLKRARNSKEGTKWLWPHNIRYILKKRPDGKRPPLSAGFKLALQQTMKNMLAASMSHNGIQGMQNFANNIKEWENSFEKNPEKAKLTLEMLYGYIEEFGTGGALFRNLFVQFLREIISSKEIREGKRPWSEKEILLLNNNIPLLEESAKNWTDFAKHIKLSLDSDNKNPTSKLDYEKLENYIREIIHLEKKFFTNINGIKL